MVETTTNSRLKAHILVGPTAVGKTAVAHLLAERIGARIVSADSMLVYRGMDVGTAKPTPSELRRFGYSGVDVVAPDRNFNLAMYIQHLRASLEKCRDKPLVVVGGTGLYVKTITRGLDDAGAPDAELRSAGEKLLQREGIEALRAFVAEQSPAAYARLKDRDNPRRLIRALESSEEVTRRWSEVEPPRMVGLRMERARLAERIAARVDRMFTEGLLREVERLLHESELSRTARQAIGYREAIAVLRGELEWPEARERICTRTRRLAKSQMTWFRNQEQVEWIDVDDMDETAIADRVEELWKENGQSELRI